MSSSPVVTMKQLLEAGVHFGHQTRRWNPKMKRFIFGERSGIYIIDLQQTLKRIETAYTFVRDMAAEGGTILLDEIAEMPLSLQAKLLRVLQEREVVPIGASVPQPIDVRVVACANRDLQSEVAAGRFRADLYYRLAVFPLTTRSLADRPQDIPALAATMILRHAGTRAVVPWPTHRAIEALVQHDCSVTLVHPDEVLGATRFPAALAETYQGLFDDAGVRVHGGLRVESGAQEGDAVTLHLSDGSSLQAAVVVIGLGIEPAGDVLAAAEHSEDGGIVVDEHLATSLPDVWAADSSRSLIARTRAGSAKRRMNPAASLCS